jgi:hypothetical protein
MDRSAFKRAVRRGAPARAVQIFVIGFTDKLWDAVPIINVAFTCHYNGPRFYQVRVRVPRLRRGTLNMSGHRGVLLVP